MLQNAGYTKVLSSMPPVTNNTDGPFPPPAPRSSPVKMPILKSLGVADSKVPRAGTLPLRSSRNPFEEVSGLEEEEAGELGALPNGTSCRRRATLEKLAGLSPFRLGKTPGRRAGSPGDGQPRSFLGRVLSPGIRRSSADFGLLARLQGIRAQGDEEAAGEAARRLAFLRLGRGPKPRRASLAERVVPAGEAAPEPPPKVPEPPKVKEPLSGELGALAQTWENHRVSTCDIIAFTSPISIHPPPWTGPARPSCGPNLHRQALASAPSPPPAPICPFLHLPPSTLPRPKTIKSPTLVSSPPTPPCLQFQSSSPYSSQIQPQSHLLSKHPHLALTLNPSLTSMVHPIPILSPNSGPKLQPPPQPTPSPISFLPSHSEPQP